MGSPSSRIKTAEKYRAWVDAGLEYVFSPGHADQVAAQPDAQQPPAPPKQPAVNQVAPSQAQHPYQQQPRQQVVQHPAQPAAQQAQPSQAVQPPQPTHQAQVNFPQPWSGFLARVKATEPKVVCTYMELGLDLGGQPDPRRGDVLRNTLTHHLKWPTGTAAFWPIAALVNGALQPDPIMFWKGWEIWRSPYIVCFGDEALRVIHPQAEPGQTTCLFDHVTIYVVPPLAKLTTMLPHEQQLAMDSLLNIRL